MTLKTFILAIYLIVGVWLFCLIAHLKVSAIAFILLVLGFYKLKKYDNKTKTS